MEQYQVILEGLSPLLMHGDNLVFAEKLEAWRKDPGNASLTASGDDRTPPWTWIGYLYHDGDVLGISADNIMTMLREGGAKMIKKGKETYKKSTQYGIMLDQQQFTLMVNDKTVPMDRIRELIGNLNFNAHVDVAESLGFELLVKRAKIQRAKHIRVRPLFRKWKAFGSVTILDSDLSGLTPEVLQTILDQAGALCGLCDWRPSSPNSGIFGRFKAAIEPINE